MAVILPLPSPCGITNQEGAEHGDGREEVPDIMVIKEVEQDAVPVVFAGFGWCFLSRAETKPLWTGEGAEASHILCTPN